MLRAIERATRQVIEPMNMPTVDAVNVLRIAKFKQRVLEASAESDAKALRPVVEQLAAESGMELIDLAAALASLAQGTTPLVLGGRFDAEPPSREPAHRERPRDDARSRRDEPRHDEPRRDEPRRTESPRVAATPAPSVDAHRPIGSGRALAEEAPRKVRPKSSGSSMETFRIEIGSTHGVKPSHVVGAIANEAGIEGVHIGRIDIREDHTFVDLPGGMPKPVFKLLQTVLVLGRELRISRVDDAPDAERRPVVRGAATSGAKPARSVSARAAPARAAPVRPDRKMLTRRAPPTRGRKD